jgi:hypothetical protein
MSSAHSELQELSKECLQRLNSIRKGDEGAVDSAETTEAARTRLDAAMEDLSGALAVVADCLSAIDDHKPDRPSCKAEMM